MGEGLQVLEHREWSDFTQGPRATPHADPAPQGGPASETAPDLSLPAAWAQFMGRHQWEWFVTLTFKDSVHPEAADKKWRLWVRRLDMHLVGGEAIRRYPDRGCVWVRGLEWQKRGVAHFHALMSYVGGLDQLAGRFEWAGEWRAIAGGFAKVMPCRNQEEARRYVSKYVAKGGEVDVSPSYHRTQAQAGLELAKVVPLRAR
jgi:hypothetical protein